MKKKTGIKNLAVVNEVTDEDDIARIEKEYKNLMSANSGRTVTTVSGKTLRTTVSKFKYGSATSVSNF